jgi:mRNA-degrading endonuclease RelE of RelBE toxin-antitoxin system
MNYSVDWSRDARSTLAAIWLGSSHRQAVTAAQARIDHLLAAGPLQHAVPQSEGLYALNVHPLRVQFELDPVRRTVWVVSVGELP